MTHLLSLSLSFLALSILLSPRTEATDRFYSDKEAKSHSGRYAVKAISPENRAAKTNRAFQKNFIYTCKDTISGKTLWTRNQPMGKPQQFGDDPSSIYTPEKEGSPSSIYISDSGYTVIYTGWQELIVIDISGKETGKLDVLADGLTKEENEKYVISTTAGPMWAGRSHWYFVEANSQEFFVIRPWWGRHLIIELATGRIKPVTEALGKATAKAERFYVIGVLQGALEGSIEKCDCCGGAHKAAFAAYLAGVLKIKEVVPALRKLEADSSIGSSTTGGYDGVLEGRIHPFNYSTYTTRQAIHLALRRLGEKPGPFPCTFFKTEHDDYEQQKLYQRKPVGGARHKNVKKVLKGMSPEQVINLLDCPDYIPSRIWQYDIDVDESYTLTVSWGDDRTVDQIEVIRPALWHEGTSRDREW